eukprot:TRINITY_DN9854_c0_g1_i1.p1 TRINITY_DN9854_c0_g1~~TRINITY_DN9854_c0_g1_i1.p1  ORF type:complete len:210 (+),score=14.22 TRINITY_DN9854_c0_g1_i1:84-713(+)
MSERIPYWGTPTASLEWCEENYAMSPYICEFWNTLSSLYITAIGLVGLCLVLGPQRTGRAHALACISLSIVGIGSALFHGTLLYTFQLMDELPMIFVSLVFIYCSLDSPRNSKLMKKLMVPFLTLYGLITTLVMLINSSNAIWHQVAYAFLVFFLILRSAYISYKLSPMSSQTKAKFKYLFWAALITYGAGYLCWIVERKLCVDHYVIP